MTHLNNAFQLFSPCNKPLSVIGGLILICCGDDEIWDCCDKCKGKDHSSCNEYSKQVAALKDVFQTFMS